MLVAETVRATWGGAVAWGLGTGVFNVFIGAGFDRQAGRFPGGPAAFGASLEVAARSMRALRWPAERV
ncbi:MAG: hypothetical protein INH41_25970, partial [Myxococcaceae bacterium]|nr:hypothetical protein [Myxococcaceae bacterium]